MLVLIEWLAHANFLRINADAHMARGPSLHIQRGQNDP